MRFLAEQAPDIPALRAHGLIVLGPLGVIFMAILGHSVDSFVSYSFKLTTSELPFPNIYVYRVPVRVNIIPRHRITTKNAAQNSST